MKTITLTENQLELLRILVDERLDRLQTEYDIETCDDTKDKLIDFGDELLVLRYDLEV